MSRGPPRSTRTDTPFPYPTLFRAFTGIRNSMLRPSIVAAGLDPDNIPPSARGKIDFDDPHNGAKAWRDIWSAGQGVGAIGRVEPIADQVAPTDRKSTRLNSSH